MTDELTQQQQELAKYQWPWYLHDNCLVVYSAIGGVLVYFLISAIIGHPFGVR